MGEIKSYPGVTGPLCDGTDPEGNVFQLQAQLATTGSIVLGGDTKID